MATITLKRQIINDDSGNPVGVILPLDEYARVKDILERPETVGDAAKIEQLRQAMRDSLFVADLHEAMSDFASSDAEWWEPGL